MVLPEPVLSDDDYMLAAAKHLNVSDLISNAWSVGPAKLAVLRAMASLHDRFGRRGSFARDITNALAQR